MTLIVRRKPRSRGARLAVIGVAVLAVLALPKAAIAEKYTGFWLTLIGSIDQNDSPDVTPGSIVYAVHSDPHLPIPTNYQSLGQQCTAKQLRVILELPFGPGEMSNYGTRVAAIRSQIPANVYSCIVAVQVGQEIYSSYLAGRNPIVCASNYPEFADLCAQRIQGGEYDGWFTPDAVRRRSSGWSIGCPTSPIPQ